MELGQKHQKSPSQGPYIYLNNQAPKHALQLTSRKYHTNYTDKKNKMKVSESKTLVWVMVVLVTASLVQESKGHPCGSTFFSALVQLIPCRAAVTPFSPVPPTESCCASIKALGQPCLCVLVNGPPISGVDRTMALQLPEKCTANFEPCEIAK